MELYTLKGDPVSSFSGLEGWQPWRLEGKQFAYCFRAKVCTVEMKYWLLKEVFV